MNLTVGTFPVREVVFGAPAGWRDGRLTVDADRVAALVREDGRIRRVAVDLVQPGDAARIVQVRDVIEPRVKTEGAGHAYPGICGHAPDTVGDGVTHRYEGFGRTPGRS